MNMENYVLIEGSNSDLVIKALQQFADMYAETDMTNNIELYKSKSKNYLFIVNASDQMDIVRFQFLVNYLKYPQKIDYNVEIKGFWTITENDKIKNSHIGQRAMFYVSPDDNEGDNVFGIFKGEDNTIKFGFAVGEQYKVLDKKEMDFYEPDINLDDFEKLATISPDKTNISKRGIGCLLTFSLLLLTSIGVTIIIILK